MNKHLPECDIDHRFCICHALRACEERTLDAAREAVIKMLTYNTSVSLRIHGQDRQFMNQMIRETIDSLRGEE